MDDVKEWLNSGQDYDAGVKLFTTYGHDKQLKKLFTQEAETPFKKKKLAAALQDLYTNHKHPTTKKAALQRIIHSQNPAENFKHWPPHPIQDGVLLSLWEQWKPLYAEMMNLQARIYDVAIQGTGNPTKAQEACDMAHRILDLDDQCDAIYSQRDYYYQFGTLKTLVIQEPIAGDPVIWATRLSTFQRYVRDYRAKLARDPKNLKFELKLKQYQDEVARYKTLLKID